MMGNPQQPAVPGRSMSMSQGSPQMMPGVPGAMGMQPGQQQMFGMEGQTWPMPGMDATMNGPALDAGSQDDTWSNSSRSGPTAPTTLNVEDWYAFVLPLYSSFHHKTNSFTPGFNSLVSMVVSAIWQHKPVPGLVSYMLICSISYFNVIHNVVYIGSFFCLLLFLLVYPTGYLKWNVWDLVGFPGRFPGVVVSESRMIEDVPGREYLCFPIAL